MTLRAGHGQGAGSPRVEVAPPDELPFAPAGAAVPLGEGRDRSGRLRTSAAARAMAKLPRRGAFVPRKLACDPRFEPHNRRRLEWLKARRSELAAATGGVSHGVGAMLAAAAWQHAAGEFAAELGAETGNVELFKTAATLSSTARQHDLAAWELACREAQARRAAAPTSAHGALAAALGSGSAEPAPAEAPRAPAPLVDVAALVAPGDAPAADGRPLAEEAPLPSRILVAGGPRVGKTTLADKLAAHRQGTTVRRTDSAAPLGWSEASAHAAIWLDAPGPWIVEGVAVPRAVRKWLASHPEGAPADLVFWSDVAHVERSAGQETMAKGCATVWREILPELLRRGVRVEPFPSEGS